MARKIEIVIAGDSDALERTLRRSSRSIDSFAGRTSRALSGIAKAGVFAGVTAGVVGLTAALRAGVGEWKEQTKQAANTRAILKATGGVANVTSADLGRLNDALLAKTGIDDEVIRSGENLLLTFKYVRNEVGEGNKVFDRATRAALDLSTAGFGSVDNASKMLGKALNDPVRGLMGLGRAGVTFTTSQRELIKELAAAGKMLEAQKVILAEVESQVGGTAEAYGKTLPGQLTILRESINNLAGDAVGLLVPSFQKMVAVGNKWISNEENQRRALADVKAVVGELGSAVRTLAEIVRAGVAVFREFRDAVGGTKNAIVLLGAAIAAVKFASLVGGFTATGAAASTAKAKVAALRATLLALPAAIGITVAVGIVINRKGISKAGEDFLRDNGLGFLAGGSSVDSLEGLPSWVQDEFRRRNQLGRRMDGIESIRTQRAAEQVVQQAPPGTSGGGSAGRRPAGLSTLSAATRAALRLAQARTPGQELAALGEQQRIVQQDIARVTRQLAGARGQKAEELAQTLVALREQEASVLGRIQSINEASTRDAQQKRDRAKDASEKRRDAIRDMVADAVSGFDLGVKGGPLTVGAVNKAVTANETAARRRRAAQEQARQFRALGLTGTGQERAPGAGGLLRLTNQMLGRAADGGKLESRLKGIRNVVTSNFRSMSEDVRRTVRSMLDDIDKQLGENKDRFSMTRTSGFNVSKATAGLGLSGAQLKALKFNLAGAHLMSGAPAAAGGGTFHITVHDRSGNPTKTAKEVKREFQKTAKSRGVQVRGPNAGSPLRFDG